MTLLSTLSETSCEGLSPWDDGRRQTGNVDRYFKVGGLTNRCSFIITDRGRRREIEIGSILQLQLQSIYCSTPTPLNIEQHNSSTLSILSWNPIVHSIHLYSMIQSLSPSGCLFILAWLSVCLSLSFNHLLSLPPHHQISHNLFYFKAEQEQHNRVALNRLM